MAGSIRSYETKQVRRGPKNKILAAKILPFLVWERTDGNGKPHIEFGVKAGDGKIVRLPFPPEFMKEVKEVKPQFSSQIAEKLEEQMNNIGAYVRHIKSTDLRSLASKEPEVETEENTSLDDIDVMECEACIDD